MTNNNFDHLTPNQKTELIITGIGSVLEIFVDTELSSEDHFKCVVTHKGDSGPTMLIEFEKNIDRLKIFLPQLKMKFVLKFSANEFTNELINMKLDEFNKRIVQYEEISENGIIISYEEGIQLVLFNKMINTIKNSDFFGFTLMTIFCGAIEASATYKTLK